MNKPIMIDDVPHDVWEVLAINVVGQPVGMETWNRCNETIKRYPEYFPWEHAYDKIPKEVHEAYDREAHPERYRPWNFESTHGFSGVIPSLSTAELEPEPQRTILEMFGLLVKPARENEDRKRAENKKSKALWDKHYSKYGLEYR